MPNDLSTKTLLGMPEGDIPEALHAALVVLAAPTPQDFPRAVRFVDFGRDSFDWPRALEEGQGWSSGEKSMLGAAAAIWNGMHDVELRTGLSDLDDQSMRRLLLAIEVQRGWRPFREALEEAAEADQGAR